MLVPPLLHRCTYTSTCPVMPLFSALFDTTFAVNRVCRGKRSFGAPVGGFGRVLPGSVRGGVPVRCLEGRFRSPRGPKLQQRVEHGPLMHLEAGSRFIAGFNSGCKRRRPIPPYGANPQVLLGGVLR